jgi:hypothetical protein
VSKGKELRKPKAKGKLADRTGGEDRAEGSLVEAPSVGLRVGKTEPTVLKVPNTRKGNSKR